MTAEDSKTALDLRIRPETAHDWPAIDRVELAAFEDAQIPPLIAAIRRSDGYLPELSLVATLPAVADPVAGHVMVSRTELELDTGTSVPILMLSPLGSIRRGRAAASARR